MENVKDYAATYYPRIPFDWLKVPLLVEPDLGSSWGTLKEKPEWEAEHLEEWRDKYA